MLALKKAYMSIMQLFLNKDGEGIQQAAQISFKEKEMAEGLRAGDWYASLDIEKKLPKIASIEKPDWDDYGPLIINDGRLVRLDDGDGNSPLQFLDKNGKSIYVYNPYFSLINGQLVITR